MEIDREGRLMRMNIDENGVLNGNWKLPRTKFLKWS